MKFLHMADCHVGGWRDEKLNELSIEHFRKVIDICLNEKVGFVLISEDLQDVYRTPREVRELAVSMRCSLEDIGGNEINSNNIILPHRDYSKKKGEFSDPNRLKEAEKFGREFIVLNRLSGYHTPEVIYHSIRQAWKQTKAYEVVLSHGKLRIGIIGYHSDESPFGLLDGRPNLEWAVQNPKPILSPGPFEELDDERILKYVLHRLQKHDLPF